MRIRSPLRAVAVAAAALAHAGAQALDYTDIFEGSFGVLSWASTGALSAPRYDGGTLHFLAGASATRTDSVRSIHYEGAASGSLLDGKLHAESTASICARHCVFQWPDSNSVGAGVGIWEKLTFDVVEGGSTIFLLPMRLRVDGIEGGAGSGRVRFYAGYGNPFTAWGRQPSNGWRQLGGASGPVDEVLDFGDVLAFAGSGMGLYIELETIAYASASGPSFADFGNTVRFEWDLPAGVTARSASGQFLAAAVPEPSPWAMLLAGGAVVGGLARRTRAAQA